MKPFTGDRPRDERLEIFCRQFALHHNKALATREAGYKPAWYKSSAHRMVRKYAAYISWLQDSQSKAISTVIAITKQSVLDEMAKIAFANPKDYIEAAPNSTPEKPTYRLKDFGALTRDQAAAIGNIRIDDAGKLTFTLARKTPELLALAKAMGLASEKLIVQHNHSHMHARLDLAAVPSEMLEEIEKLLTTGGAKVLEHESAEG